MKTLLIDILLLEGKGELSLVFKICKAFRIKNSFVSKAVKENRSLRYLKPITFLLV